jgi:hypothetical protein
MTFARAQLDEILHRLFIDASATSLRDEDRRKSDEMAGLLVEVATAVARRSTKSELVLADAAAGKAYVGLLAAELILAPRGQPARVRVIEREPARVAACGPASDAIIDQVLAVQARMLLLVPCCTSKDVAAAALAQQRAEQLGLPRHAEVRRRFIQSIVDAERTLRLEAAGWQTTVVNFVAPTVTPHNLLWRAERVGEPGRMAEAAERLARLRDAG